MFVYTSKKEKVVLADEPFAAGGEGEVRMVTFCPPRFSSVCAKLYFKQRQTKDQERKIRFMVDNPPNTIVGNGMMLSWPLETIHNQKGDFLGFIMPIAFSGSKKLVILTLPKIKKTLKEEWYKFDKELDIKNALVARLKLINNIAIPVHLLHATGKYVLKDFKPDNVLVTPNGKVTIVDMDSIQICNNGKLLFAGTAATAEYMPPEFYNNGVGIDKTIPLEQSWDNFALAEVFYQLLFGLNPFVVVPRAEGDDSHTIPYCIAHNLFPFGGHASQIESYAKPHNNFNILPQPVKDLFLRAFGDNPSDRPLAMEWGRTINSVIINGSKTPSPKKTVNTKSSNSPESPKDTNESETKTTKKTTKRTTKKTTTKTTPPPSHTPTPPPEPEPPKVVEPWLFSLFSKVKNLLKSSKLLNNSKFTRLSALPKFSKKKETSNDSPVTELTEGRYCAKCGTLNSLSAKYCKSCGHTIRDRKQRGNRKQGCFPPFSMLMIVIIAFFIVISNI